MLREDDNISFITQQEQQHYSKRDPRYYIADELLQTEKNYVSILTTIIKVDVLYTHFTQCTPMYCGIALFVLF